MITRKNNKNLKTPFEKGKHISPETEFKKGNIPHNLGKTKENYEPLRRSSMTQSKSMLNKYKDKKKFNPREWRIKNREYIKNYNDLYYQKFKNKLSQNKVVYYKKNIEKIKIREKENYEKNREIKKRYSKNYYSKNRDEILRKDREKYQENHELEINKAKRRYLIYGKKHARIYYQNNKDEINRKRRANLKERRKRDLNFLILSKLRCCLSKALRIYTETGKIMSSEKYGINYKKIVEHLKPFPENLSKYHIDHIKPLCSFSFINSDGSTDLEEVKKAFAPENHQWLFAEDNLKKGKRFDVQLNLDGGLR